MDPIHERVTIERPHNMEFPRYAAHDDGVRDDVAAVVQLASDLRGVCRLTALVKTNGRRVYRGFATRRRATAGSTNARQSYSG